MELGSGMAKHLAGAMLGRGCLAARADGAGRETEIAAAHRAASDCENDNQQVLCGCLDDLRPKPQRIAALLCTDRELLLA